ncbi:hypothetical protein IGI04_042958 [Brassica rapa subsp. trilocularis]|uniref:Uncharacterized protein n=1 Tax=Brassica rapa subsp. trilocularis TaxID=1813537 RepID=A0ABQ7KIM0_BRACM|nr:hypothetical protein IGI04_042958 [Brassica rapa subsp. trilocularis]
MCTSLGQKHPDGRSIPSVRLPISTLAHQYAWPRSYQGKMLTLGWMMESRARISTTWTNQTDLASPVHQNSSLCSDQYTDQSTGRASMLICVLTWCISCPKSVHGQSTGRASMLICVLSKISTRTVHGKGQHADMCGQHADMSSVHGSVHRSVHGQSTGRASMLICVYTDPYTDQYTDQLQFWLDRTHSFRISPNPGTKSVKENATKQPAFANPETVFVRKQCCNSLGQKHPAGSIKTQERLILLQYAFPSVRLPISTLGLPF